MDGKTPLGHNGICPRKEINHMCPEVFAALFVALKEEFPEGEVLFDGKDTISVKVHIFRCSGIWITILNVEEEDCWSTCIELREANGKLWERHLADLEGQEQQLDCFIREFLTLSGRLEDVK